MKWKEVNAVNRVSKEDAPPLIDSVEAEVTPPNGSTLIGMKFFASKAERVYLRISNHV